MATIEYIVPKRVKLEAGRAERQIERPVEPRALLSNVAELQRKDTELAVHRVSPSLFGPKRVN
jgi:hypothetical protein